MSEVKDRMYTVFPARLLKIVAAAADQECGNAVECLHLKRSGAKQTITACNGHVLVSVTVAADKSLFESGRSLLLPRDLVNAICKTPIKSDTDVEIVDTETVTQAHLPSGLAIEYGRNSQRFPVLDDVCKPPREDVTITVSSNKLRTVLNALHRAMPNAGEYTFKIESGKNMLYITAFDEDANALAVIAGAESQICDVPKPKESVDSDTGEVTAG